MSVLDEYTALIEEAGQQLDKLTRKHELEQLLSRNMQKTFADNMLAFEKYYPDIAKKFKDYKPESMNFFCAKSGDANILFGKAKAPIYNDDPVQQCKDQVDSAIESPQFTSLSFNLDDGEKGEENFIHAKYLTEIHEIYLKNKEELEPISRMPDHIGGMITFGIGLGYHLPYLVDKITISHLYLCEPDCDLFYASLYTCDWAYVLKVIDDNDGYLYLHLGVSYKEFTSDFLNELRDKGAFNAVNSVLYQHYPSIKLTEIIDNFSKDFHLVAMGWGFFDDGIISLAHDFANAQQNIPVLKKDAVLPKKWRDTPAFIVANGPSLDEAIDTIKAYGDNAIIFSCGSVLPSLLAHGIYPDFHIELERTRLTYDYLYDLIDREAMSKINFLTMNVMHPKCPELFKWTGMGFKPTEPSTIIACDYINNNKDFVQMKMSNPAVANTGMSFACYMGFEEVYLFGVDNGYKDRTHHHSRKSLYYTEEGKEKEDIGNLVRAGEIEVEGNFGEPIISTVFFNTARFYLEKILNIFPKVNCYNCSDGAKIGNTYPLLLENILLANGEINKNDLVEFLKEDAFINRNFSSEEYEGWIAIDIFNEICDKLIEFVDIDFTSRAELVRQLTLQVRYLYSYANTPFRHIYFMLEGSITYVHTLFRLMMFDFADEKATLKCVQEGVEIFKTYLQEAKKKYANVLTEVDDHSYNVVNMFR